jgi:hypothetical protein
MLVMLVLRLYFAQPLPKSLPFIRIMFLDEFADEELAIHAHHMSYSGYHLNMETGTWECFSIYPSANHL